MSAPARLPPAPPLPRIVQSALLWRRTLPLLGWCERRYGDCFRLYAHPMGQLVYVADVEEIKRVFTGDASLFHAGEGNSVLGEVLGPHSLLLLDEDRHLRQRRLMLPPFHGDHVRRYTDLIARATEEELERWPLREPIELLPRMQAITLEVILRVVIGVEDPVRLERLRELMPRVMGFDGVTGLLFVRPGLGRVGPWRRYRRTVAAVDALLYEEIAQRRRDPRLEDRDDVLSMLMRAADERGERMTDEELRDELITLLVAGHETTATGLAWAFERLMRTPRVLARLLDELDGGDDAYLDAVVKETLRARPVIADVARRLTADIELCGYRVPAGATVMPAIALVQSSPRHHAEPDEFRPERFLDGSPAPYTWIPFGGGRRRCIGAAFATAEMKVVLGTVLSRVRLAAARPEPEGVRVRHITMLPARGGEAVVTERIPSRALAGAT